MRASVAVIATQSYSYAMHVHHARTHLLEGSAIGVTCTWHASLRLACMCCAQQAESVRNDDQTRAHVGKYSHPHGGTRK